MIKEERELLELKELIEKIKESEKYILVEGKSDKIALQRLGLGKIIVMDKRPIYIIVEDIVKKTKRLIILTDIDKEGKKLYGRIKSEVSQFGVEVDNRYREIFYKKTKLRQVEGLIHYMKRLDSQTL
jgi:5S rRNA maturation endonuclease (ribonuclease M5)